VLVLEQEMKIPVASLEEVRRRLRERGAHLLEPAAFEDNCVLDDSGHALATTGRLLRLRRFGTRCTLTLKGAAAFAGGVKSRSELETEVADAEKTLAILEGLGYRPVRRYQKRRETWSSQRVTVALDETPMGSFVELEGEGTALAGIAVTLGLDPKAAVLGTYLDLWSAFRATHPAVPEDMVFASNDGREGRPA
jgi:adenylate cyclase class 2